MNIEKDKPPSQIDYILLSERWASAALDCKSTWGLAICAYGRKYDHSLLTMKFKLRLKREKITKRKDFSLLRNVETSSKHNDMIGTLLTSKREPTDLAERWELLKTVMIEAQEAVPTVQPCLPGRKWKTSDTTVELVKRRVKMWEIASEEERKALTKDIKTSARRDYVSYVEGVLLDIENAENAGDSAGMYKLAKTLSTKQHSNRFTQPSVDSEGKQITSVNMQLDAWADFLEKKFSPLPGEVDYDIDVNTETHVPDVTLEEVKHCIKQLKSGKACGPDTIPIEQFKSSDNATKELHILLSEIWQQETLPEDFVLGDMLMFYKKKCKNDRRNYRALGLLNHAYKVFAMILLSRMLPFITERLSDMQAGFRKGRGCRDNITILLLTVRHLLDSAEDSLQSQGVITYIDFSAAFDSISHSYLLKALDQYEVPKKYCRLVKAIYQKAAVRVKMQEPNGKKVFSRSVSIKRGVIQGDIPSPLCFLVALDKLLKDHGQLEQGLIVQGDLKLAELTYADDAALGSRNTTNATERLTNLDQQAKAEAGMDISIPKTKVQHIKRQPNVGETTEDDVSQLPAEKKFKFECEKCGMTYPTKAGLSIHKGRWCGRRRSNKKPSRKGTVADRVIKRMKVEEHQKSLPVVKIGDEKLENVYSFVYLGAEIACDGDPLVTAKHRCDVGWGRFNDYRKVFTTAKLPVALRVRLYKSLVATSLIYGSCGWLITTAVRRMLNNTNSKMLSLITKRSIHDEAREPSFDLVLHIYKQRWEYLGHILRLPENRALKMFTCKLSPQTAPFIQGSLLDDTDFLHLSEAIDVASDRQRWRSAWKCHRNSRFGMQL